MGYNDAGGANNVQAGDPGDEADAEGLAGAYQQLVGRNKKAQGPNANAYNKQVGSAQGNADAYSQDARTFTQDAPTIANAYQDQSRSDIGLNTGSERYLGDHLRDIMEGKDVTGAQAQIQQGTDAGIAAQMNVAHSAKGGGAAQAGAVRSAQQQGALQQAGVAAQAGQLQAQLASAAAGQQANVYGNIGSQLGQQYGLEQGSAIHQADLQSTNQGQIDQTKLGYGALGNGAQGGSLAALNGYTNGNLSAQGLQPGIDAENGGGKLVGTAASVAGAALMSDERVKTGISSEGTGGSRVDAFLDGIHPLSYHYKQAANEPRSQATGGRYLGISAQDLEAVPEVGHQMVSEGPRGKQVEIGPSLSAALAGVARLNERLKAVEGAKGVTSDMAAKTDVATEGDAPYVDPRAKAWDEGHNEALNKVQQYRQMTPEQLKELGDKGNRLANAVRGAKADAWDEAHGRNQSMTPSLVRQPTSFTRGDEADASRPVAERLAMSGIRGAAQGAMRGAEEPTLASLYSPQSGGQR